MYARMHILASNAYYVIMHSAVRVYNTTRIRRLVYEPSIHTMRTRTLESMHTLARVLARICIIWTHDELCTPRPITNPRILIRQICL